MPQSVCHMEKSWGGSETETDREDRQHQKVLCRVVPSGGGGSNLSGGDLCSQLGEPPPSTEFLFLLSGYRQKEIKRRGERERPCSTTCEGYPPQLGTRRLTVGLCTWQMGARLGVPPVGPLQPRIFNVLMFLNSF